MMKRLKNKAGAAALGVSLLGAVVASVAAHATAAADGGASAAVPAVLAVTLAPFDPAMAQAPTIEPNPKNVDYPVPTAGSVYFVSTTGHDAADGRSITTPFKTLGRALTVAKAGPRPATVIPRAGTYEEGDVGANITGTAGGLTFDGNRLTGGSGSRRLFNSSTGVADLAARVPADTFITAMDYNGYHRPTAAGGSPTPATFAGWLHPRPAVHGSGWLDNVTLSAVTAAPEMTAAVLAGAEIRLNTCADFYDAMLARFRSAHSATVMAYPRPAEQPRSSSRP